MPTQHALLPLDRLETARFETPAILRQVASAARRLAELKGLAASFPHQAILISALGLQEAQDSTAIENVITTLDALLRDAASPEVSTNSAAQEVFRYRQALAVGFDLVRQHGLLLTAHVLEIQAALERNTAGFRRLPGTVLKDGAGRTVYTPPQQPAEIVRLMGDLERFINDNALFDADPLIKMALIHHQFESIHPFYDGNGRTGRIMNVLYLVKEGLLGTPILPLSRGILRTTADYYRLLRDVRERDAWEEWVLYILRVVEGAAAETLATVTAIKSALMDYKHRIRAAHRFYSHDLINTLFMHPCSKIETVRSDLGVSRITATKYLDALAAGGFVEKRRIGRTNYYINRALQPVFAKSWAPET